MIQMLLIAGVLLPALAWAGGSPPTLVVLGDSLSAAYGIETKDGWVNLLRQRLSAEGFPHHVINASVSGDTTGAGLTRLPQVLDRHRPALVVIALGANDGLRGTPTKQIGENLRRLVDLAQGAGAKPLLVGVRLPPNYGAAYTQGFQATLTEVAQATGTPLIPDLLAGVAEDRDLMQADGLHPTSAAQARILDTVWTGLSPLLEAPAGTP
jgi:acyl-CoA thioesterase-1